MRLCLLGPLLAAVASGGCGDEGQIGDTEALQELTTRVEESVPAAVYDPSANVSATDLDFNPERPGELWITLRLPYDDTLLCTETMESSRACSQLEGRVVLMEDATEASPSARVESDPNGWHFLRRPPAIAFGVGDTFGTCGEARTGNFEDTEPDYIGPTLWSSDPAIFGQLLSETANGSHIDMLHSSPFCVGIAHEKANVYWVFNGQLGSLDRNDFKMPHEPGGEDHSDGELTRYIEGALTRVPNVPGHIVIDQDAHFLYVADTGGGRVVRVDITTGAVGATIPCNDPLQVRNAVDDVDLEVLVPPGVLQRPAGIALFDSERVRGFEAERGVEVLLVTDNATSFVHVFSKGGQHLGELDTELPVGSLGGIVQGPDGLAYFTDLISGRVFRLE